jgi:creatinine amidohydrolase
MVTVFNTSKEIGEAGPELAILPIGAIEQHGEHLPVATDWILADHAAELIARHLNCYLLPAICYGNSQEHMNLPGSITLRPATLAMVIEDIVMSLRHQGIRRIVVLSSHGGNWIVKPTIRDLNFRYADIRIIHYDGVLPEETDRTPKDIHSGASETAAMLNVRPDLVKAVRHDCSPPFGQEWNDYAGYEVTTETGVWGVPSAADPETSREGLERIVAHSVAYISATFARLDELLGPL